MNEDDSTSTTCNYAIPCDNGDVIGLIVCTDGEDFFSRLTIFKDFSNENERDIFDDQVFITSFEMLAPNHFILAEGTGKIIEIVDGDVRETVDLRAAIGGIHRASDGSILVWGPRGIIARRDQGAWTRLPPVQQDIHCARIVQGALYISGGDGLFARWSGQGWELLDLGTNVTLHVLFDLQPGILVLGRAGQGGLWRDNTWNAWDLPEVSFYSISEFRGDMYVGAGADGLYIMEGTNCRLKREPLYAYKLRASSKYLAISGANEIIRFDGKSYPCLEFNEDIFE